MYVLSIAFKIVETCTNVLHAPRNKKITGSIFTNKSPIFSYNHGKMNLMDSVRGVLKTQILHVHNTHWIFIYTSRTIRMPYLKK